MSNAVSSAVKAFVANWKPLPPRALLRLWIYDPQPGRARCRPPEGGPDTAPRTRGGTEAVPPPSAPCFFSWILDSLKRILLEKMDGAERL